MFTFQPNTLQRLRVTKVSSHELPPPVNSQSNGVKETAIDDKLTVDCQNKRRTWPSTEELENVASHGLRTPADSVDKVSRVLFPVLFVVFNVVYWTVYVLPG